METSRQPSLRRRSSLVVVAALLVFFVGAGFWESILPYQPRATLSTSKNASRYVEFSPDGKTLVVQDDDLIVHDVTTGRLERIGGRSLYPDVCYSPDGSCLLARRDDVLEVWDVRTMERRSFHKGHRPGYARQPSESCFSPDGKILAVPDDGRIQLWDGATGQLNASIEGDGLHGFSPDTKWLAYKIEGHKSVRLWDVQARKEWAAFGAEMQRMAFSPDSKTLAIYDEYIKLWDVARLKLLARLHPTSGTIEAVAFSPDGKTLASVAGLDVKFWDLTSKRELAVPPEIGHSPFAFSSDGKVFVCGTALWDVTARPIRKICFLELAASGPTMFAPNGEIWGWVGSNPDDPSATPTTVIPSPWIHAHKEVSSASMTRRALGFDDFGRTPRWGWNFGRAALCPKGTHVAISGLYKYYPGHFSDIVPTWIAGA